jgi:hypothetical protein
MQELPKGPGAERSNGSANPPGIYHLENGAQIITASGSEGASQADALVRVGFKYAAPVPSRQELLEMQKAQAAKEAPKEAPKPEVKN